MSDNNVKYINVTEIRGVPLIVVSAYDALFVVMGVIFIKWVGLVFKAVCQNKEDDAPLAHAHPIRQWLHDALTPTSATRSHELSTFASGSDSESEVAEGGEGGGGGGGTSPTAAEIRPTDGLDSNG